MLTICVLVSHGSDIRTETISSKYRTLDKIFLDIQKELSDQGTALLKPGRKAVTVTDNPENLKSIRELVEAYDVPFRKIEVTIKLIEASKSRKNPEMSREIRHIGSRLKNVLRFTSYNLLDTAVLQGIEGGSSDTLLAGSYRIKYDLDFINDGTGIIKLENFNLSKQLQPTDTNRNCSSLISTSMNIINGEEIICGASKMEEEDERSLILVISVKTLGS